MELVHNRYLPMCVTIVVGNYEISVCCATFSFLYLQIYVRWISLCLTLFHKSASLSLWDMTVQVTFVSLCLRFWRKVFRFNFEIWHHNMSTKGQKKMLHHKFSYLHEEVFGREEHIPWGLASSFGRNCHISTWSLFHISWTWGVGRGRGGNF